MKLPFGNILGFLKPFGLLAALSFFPYSGLFAQLNCKTFETKDSIKTKCYHINKNVSTIERWDKQKRWGWFSGYNPEGKEIFSYDLRRVAGHASVHVTYFPNGQAHKVNYSSAPDGGIQFYKIYHEFNELGEQVNYMDFSQPDGRPVLVFPRELRQTPDLRLHTILDPPAPNPAECAVPHITSFRITNETRRKVIVTLTPLSSQWVSLKSHREIVINPKSSILIDSVTLAERFLPINETYRVEALFKRKRKSPRIILAYPIENENRKEYIWHIVD